MNTPVKKQELIQKLRALTEKLGHVPTGKEFYTYTTAGRYHIEKIWGSYKNFLIENGVGAEYRTQRSKEVTEAEPNKLDSIIAPLIPDSDLPVEEIIDTMCKRYSKKRTSHDAKKWMEFKVETDLPIAICWFGDPHIDDDGCNWPQLKRDIDICKNTPGMFGANIGDTTNNWVGRLIKEYANQSTTRSTAWKLIDWFFKESGVKWLIWLLGNHDSWNYGGETMAKVVQHTCPMIEWRAQFKLTFTNGRSALIDAAHDHNGQSQWNSLHAQQKASTMGGIAHLYIAGHRHNWALAQNECPHTNRIYWLARARGYKEVDSYAENLGFGEQKSGAAIVSVIDPRANDVNMIRCFADVAEGASYLNFLREKYIKPSC